MVEFYINGFSSFLGDIASEQLTAYFEARRLRRMEAIAKNALFCSCQALEQAGHSLSEPKDLALSVAVGAGSLESTCKFMDSIITDGDELSSPTAFAGSVHNATGLMLSMFLNLHGPCVTTGQFDFSFAGALLTAQQFLKSGQANEALVVVAEDINPVSAEYAPQNPALFAPVIRCPQGPFARAAAAFVISLHPTAHTIYQINRLEFTRLQNPVVETATAATAAWNALEFARLMQEEKSFILTDSFACATLLIEGNAYAKP